MNSKRFEITHNKNHKQYICAESVKIADEVETRLKTLAHTKKIKSFKRLPTSWRGKAQFRQLSPDEVLKV